jgi:hypothetical protein
MISSARCWAMAGRATATQLMTLSRKAPVLDLLTQPTQRNLQCVGLLDRTAQVLLGVDK